MRSRRLTRTTALGLALAALAAPAAAAQQDLRNPDRRATEIALAQEQYYGSFGDGAGKAAQDLRSPDARDYADGRGTSSAPDVTVVKVAEPSAPTAPAGGGLDWGDAGIGAGIALGVMLMGLAGVLGIVHRRHTALLRRPASPTG
jgi:hypothetical protein